MHELGVVGEGCVKFASFILENRPVKFFIKNFQRRLLKFISRWHCIEKESSGSYTTQYISKESYIMILNFLPAKNLAQRPQLRHTQCIPLRQ